MFVKSSGPGERPRHASKLLLAALVLTSLPFSVGAEPVPVSHDGQVEIPLELYNQLIENARNPDLPPRPAPARHALGQAQVAVTVSETAGLASAEVRMELEIEILEGGWTAVPILPPGSAVESATVGGKPVQLLSTAGGLVWGTRKAGRTQMVVTYRVDARASGEGFSLALPVAEAAVINLDARMPGTNLDVAVIPAAGVRTNPAGNTTRVLATVPTTSGIQLSWRPPVTGGYSLGRAVYRGTLEGNAVRWQGRLQVDVWNDASLTVPLLRRTVALSALAVDGKEAPILLDGDCFAALIEGRGRHEIVLGFEVPIQRGEGPPKIDLQVPEVPVSRFELVLPGRKEVQVTPSANVETNYRGESTVSTVHVPLTDQIQLSWAEAVPEDVKAESRANAGIYHAAHAEEGVLYLRALVDYEISRGETNLLRLEVPGAVQVNRVSSPSGAVADWRLAGKGPERELAVFLDRQVRGSFPLEVLYDLSLPAAGEALEVPLLRAFDTQRQRGMVALLQSRDLVLEPVADQGATRVGVNQLPAFVRQALEMPVAHTFKYVETPPEITVRAAAPERQQGRFDSRVDTLVSLGEVTLEGSASVEIDVKSGRIMELDLTLPVGVDLLGLTGPSIRNHTVEDTPEGQNIAVEFTQEMEGQFRLEVSYEQLLVEGEPLIEVPVLEIEAADVSQGRLAVEALSAVEVQPAVSEQLTAIDLVELPQQLVLRTTNPILMAFKYVSAPFRLALSVTRHQVVDVQPAAIDRAEYRTLIIRDGLAVTTANFRLRNSGEQFLRIQLPDEAKIWSAFVDGRPIKPARATNEGEADEKEADEKEADGYLLKIIHSTRPFVVELIYESPSRPIRGLGTLRATLPRPEILVTHSRWDLYVPDDVRYGQPRSSMEVVTAGSPMSADELDGELSRLEAGAGSQVLEPLRLSVPTAGLHFAFEKLYANRSEELTFVTLPFASGQGRSLGTVASLVAALLLWLGLAAVLRGRLRLGLAASAVGGSVLLVLSTRYQLDLGPALWLSLLVGLGAAAHLGRRFWGLHRGGMTAEEL